MRRGYVILDLETTGMSPRRGDRIIEVGAVYMRPDLSIDAGIETLINPRRDVGPTSVHGITARDVFDAPTFGQVAPKILEMLDGRVIVGHNVGFDLRFLEAELHREGYDLPEFVTIDTLSMARRALKKNPPTSCTLGDLSHHLGCEHETVFEALGLEKRPAHSAFGDAMVTTFVLTRLMEESSSEAFWEQHLSRAEAVMWPEYMPVEVRTKRRGDALPEPDIRSGITTTNVSLNLPMIGASILEDRTFDSSTEPRGTDSLTLGSLRRGEFDQVVFEAWADGVLEEHEQADILRVARLLDIDDDTLANALRGSPPTASADSAPMSQPAIQRADFGLAPSSIIVLTGEMKLERSQIEAQIVALGHRVGSNVTKKTNLLIAADPYTQSGKAKKARQYGIRVLGQEEGFSLLGLPTLVG